MDDDGKCVPKALELTVFPHIITVLFTQCFLQRKPGKLLSFLHLIRKWFCKNYI
jgi:hypothetical protein